MDKHSMSRKQRYPSEKGRNFWLEKLTPRNDAQSIYMDLIRESTVTFGVGPAGTAKTYIAVYCALESLMNSDVAKVILTRPIVAVEDIGYLPGDMHEKIHPYVLPLLDAIEDHIGTAKAKELLNTGLIDIIPLAYCRGRTFKHAAIIADEMQNSTMEQMKMLLTRLGEGSRITLTGDTAQSDLPVAVSGLQWAIDKMRGVSDDISVHEFNNGNIVRHPLIETMLTALDKGPSKQYSRNDGPGRLLDKR
jgi:phosphate starvation-inducible PhoH-like protein